MDYQVIHCDRSNNMSINPAKYLMDLVRKAEESSLETMDGGWSPRCVPVTIWAGFARVGSGRGKEVLAQLKAAGATRVMFTPTNDSSAGKAWKWSPARKVLLDGMKAAKDMDFEIGLGPWVWCDATAMDTCGKKLRELSDEVGGVSCWELDAEGSFELTAKRKKKRTGDSYDKIVSDALDGLLPHMKDEELAVTLLYFNRPGGNALLRHSRVRSCIVQAYSVWFSGSSSKAKATHASNFQPGILQERAWDNYEKFKEEHDIDSLLMGMGWWAQDRRGAPPNLRISQDEGFRRASDATIKLGADGACGWAMHLWDSTKKKGEVGNLTRVLREVKYLTSGGTAKNYEEDRVELDSPPGVDIHWGDQFPSESRIPDGYMKIDGVDDPRGKITLAARAIRAANHTVVRPQKGGGVGMFTPFNIGHREYGGLDEYHGATFRGGKRVRVGGKGIHGVTIFEKKS